MARGLTKIAVGGLVLVCAGIGYRLATANVNDDFRNYEVVFNKLEGWKELPHSPNTLLLMKHPPTNALLRCSATQIVSETNPEPDMDTTRIVQRVVQNAQENQPEWKTEHLKPYDNGKVGFELFRKTNSGKTIVGAMAVRGNTTLLVSMSNTGEGAKTMAQGNYELLLAFLKTVDLQVTDKWEKIHAKYEETPTP
ncbi:MAG: hypothetical protein H7Y17_16605 [Chlorobia bacterium]|nr:hypothetical protein [Fimbriimonadaceae bacterium]